MLLGGRNIGWICGGSVVRSQHVRHIGVGFVIVRLQFQGAADFLISVLPILQLDIALSQLIMCSREGAIYLCGIEKLDYGLSILPLGVISLPTLKVLLLSYVRIARTASQHGR